MLRDLMQIPTGGIYQAILGRLCIEFLYANMSEEAQLQQLKPVPFLTPLVVGFIICLVQYGISVSQVYLYIFTSERDSRRLKYLVIGVFLCETLQTVILARALVYYTVLAFGNPTKIAHIDWSIMIWLMLMVPIVALTQGFYIRRVYILSKKSKWLLIPSVFFLTLRLGFHMAASIYTAVRPQWKDLSGDMVIKLCIEVTNSVAVITDGLLAFSLVYYLYQSRSDFDQTESIVRWIMAYTVNTGLLTMIVSVVIVVTFVCIKDSLLYAGLIAVEARVYSNCLLGALNARPTFRAKLPSNVFDGNHSYEMSRLGLARGVPRIEVFQETLAVKADDRVRSCVLPTVYTIGENTLSQSITEVSLKESPVIDLTPKSDGGSYGGSSIETVDKVKEG